MRLCFVCLGNIVRSPLAEHLFTHLAEEEGLAEKYQVDSAGTSAYHVGESPDARMRKVAREHGLIYDGRSRQFRRDDFERFDLIIAMDADNRRNLRRLAFTQKDKDKIRLMREFDPQGSPNAGVPDPYYGVGLAGFEKVYKIVERSCRGLLESLEKEESTIP
ncbi:MAG: Low molecular weight protein-tyrosine-phosphatase YfkJ [Chloroflexi bacterium]|nr:Low molecular weight protein-tyrosine-phosphatase YfkJ [Chloroflexota bacterium]